MNELRIDARMALANYESSYAAFGAEASFTMEDVYAVREYIDTLEAALRVAAGYISTKEGHTDQHPQDVYDWIVSAALAGEKKDEP